MVNIAELKSIATPFKVAEYFLGSPAKKRRNELWYKSPFREETDASFEVSDRGFHDFGDNEHYDVISFVQRLKRCSFKEAVEILSSIFGIKDEGENKKLQQWLKEQEIKNEIYREKVEKFYLDLWEAAEEESKTNRECIEIFQGQLDNESYKICLDHQFYLDYVIEHLTSYTNSFKEKEEIYRQYKRGELPKWLTMRLENYTTLSMISDMTQLQNNVS